MIRKKVYPKSFFYILIPFILVSLSIILFCKIKRGHQFLGQQIVVMKGWEGFADRLQVLSHCLHYCKLHNAAICIDWRDYMWGQESLDFSDYFEIINVPVVTLSDVIERVKQGAVISPPAWTLETLSVVNNESLRFKEYECEFNNSYDRIDAEIIVTNCKGIRTYHIDNLISNIRLKKNIAEIISSRLQNVEIPYTVIHLRGTDRLAESSLEDSIKPAVELIKVQPPHINARMYVISDMKQMVDMWVDYFPQTKKLYSDYEIYKLPDNLRSGTHKMTKEVLEFYGLKKHNMNIDTIFDFIVISFSKWCFGNSKESTYTKMGKFIGQSGKIGVSKWLGGFYPVTSSLKT
jgi:hypothetical protein